MTFPWQPVLTLLGGAVGFAAAVLVLRARGVLSAGTVAALLWACLGVHLGARVQFRLESMPLLDALAMTPADLAPGGWRLPLGLLTGGVMACAWSAARGLSWRATGDAFAVGASVLIPFARLGCLTAGCCMGGVCGRWAIRAFCIRVGPTSEAFHRQLADGLISPTSPLSLPAHALPVYFGLASLATLAVLVWQLRRGAAPGVPLLTFCILRPVAKLVFESMRATPRPSVLMTAIPAAVLAVSLGVAVALALRAAGNGRRIVRLGELTAER